MLSSFMISQSGAQARAIWYILKTAVCPVAGSTFSGSCFAVVGAGVFEQAVRIASRAMAGKMDGFSICTCVPILAMGARVRHAVPIRNAIFGGIMWAVNGGGTLGVTNQWHFYAITNSNSYTNAAFLTFLPNNLAVTRMGVFEPSADLATRPEADIDLYVAPPSIPNNFALTNLDPVVVAAASKSLLRGGTETIVYSNATPGVYYLGVKSEDQQAAEYALMGVFSELPFGTSDSNGVHLVGIPLFQPIPDGSPQFPGVALIVAPNVDSLKVRRVIVTNVVTHELMSDLFGNLNHGAINAVLNNHTCVIDPATTGCQTWTSYIYDDSAEHNVGPDPSLINPHVQHTDGPGSLNDFAGKEGLGQWLLTMVDNATKIGRGAWRGKVAIL